MRNKIVIENPDNNNYTHQWDKFYVNSGKHYQYDKYAAIPTTTYYWQPHFIRYENKYKYYWDKYTTKTDYKYHSWVKEDVTATPQYKWNKYHYLSGTEGGYMWMKSYPVYTYDVYNAVFHEGTGNRYSVSDVGIEYSPQFATYTYDPDDSKLDILNYDYDNEKYSFYANDILPYWIPPNDIRASLTFFYVEVNFYEDITVDAFTGERVYVNAAPFTGKFYPHSYYNRATDTTTRLSASGISKVTQMNYLDNIFMAADDATGYNIQELDFDVYKYMEVRLCHSVLGEATPTQNIILETQNVPSMNTEWGWHGGDCHMISLCCAGKDDDGYVIIGSTLTHVKTYGIEENAGTDIDDYYSKGEYIKTITSDSDDYPHNGNGDNEEYWYVYVGLEPGEEIGTVYAAFGDAYPRGGVQDGYYYSNRAQVATTNDMRTDFIEVVYAAESDAYPSDGVENGYWYVYQGTDITNNAYKTAVFYEDYKVNGNHPVVQSGGYLQYSAEMPATITDKLYGATFSWTNAHTTTAAITTELLQELYNDGNKFIVCSYHPSGTYILLTEESNIENGVFQNVCVYTAKTFTDSAVGYGDYLGTLALDGTYWQQETQFSTQPDILLSEVSADNEDEYPKDGVLNGYWYISTHRETLSVPVAGNSTANTDNFVYDAPQIAFSNDINTYPLDGIKGDYWYKFLPDRTTTSYRQGDWINKVILQNKLADTFIGGYYYINMKELDGDYQGNYIETVESENYSEYPTNGIQNSYWYVYKGYESSFDWTIDDSKLIGGVTYKQDINPEEDYVIGTAAAASIEFVINDDLRDSSRYLGLTCKYYCMMGNEKEWTLMGKFNITDCQEKTTTTTKIVAYDNVSKFDCYVDDWIEAQTFPMTLKEMFNSLCIYVLDYYDTTYNFINSDFIVNDNFTGTQITGRQVLQYIAQAAAANAVANPDGNIIFCQYSNKGVVLDKSKYVKLTNSIYNTQQIDKVNIQMTEDDLGTTSGDGDNCYFIVNNPLFYADSATSNQEACDNILKVVSTVSYTPAEITLLQDFGINCGDIITVDDMTVYVMSKKISNSGVTLSCVGNQVRATQGNSTNSEIVALRGKTNELERTLEMTQSTIGDVSQGLQSQITQKVDSIQSTITQQGATITEIKQGLDGIKLTYNSTNGTASITIGDITVSNLVDDEYVNEVVAGVSVNGYVKFSDLSQSGSTVINGDNITTGSIDADRLNLKGAISWGDLTSSCRDRIEEMVSGEYELPDYIHSTYIDDCEIYSPTIYGAKIYAGTRAEGYMKLTSSGMNFCSENGGALVGMGYYAGNYKYPYIIFGQGVDEYGTDRGMIKKFGNGIWIGDSDSMTSSTVGSGTGLFVDFNAGKIYKYVNGTRTEL